MKRRIVKETYKDGKIITYSETDGYKFDEPNFHIEPH